MDHRSVPVEVLREFVRDQAELSSVRQVAAEIGLGRTTLHSFVTGESTPHPRVRRLIALWYLQKTQNTSTADAMKPYAAALEILLGDIPTDRRGAAEHAVLELLAQTHTAEGGRGPHWLELLRRKQKFPD
jgi:hypothetical protein